MAISRNNIADGRLGDDDEIRETAARMLVRMLAALTLVTERLRIGHRFIGAPSPELRDDGAIQDSSVVP